MPKSKRKVAIFGHEPVTGKLGGLGIRQLEIARTLAKQFEVRLMTAYEPEGHLEKFPIKKIRYQDIGSVKQHIKWADIVFASQPAYFVTQLTTEMKKPLALDLCPITYFEEIERLQSSGKTEPEKYLHLAELTSYTLRQIAAADFFICASDRERDYYIGILTIVGKLLPDNYKNNRTFENIISVAPYGLPKRKPRTGKNLLKGKLPGIEKKDFIILWGGSIWDWFDCLTPIRAMARLKKTCPRAKLVFMGTTHPATDSPPSQYQKAVNLAKKRKILNKNVFFLSDWIPFREREYYLTESDIGITTFEDTIENRFAFRIRLMDYLWAGLPIVTNPGNVLSDLIEKEEIGTIVPFGDDKILAKKIESFVKQPLKIKKLSKNITAVKKRFYWDETLKPLTRFIEKPSKAESIFSLEQFAMSFFELNRLKLKKVLFLRSSPISHSQEAVKALKIIAPHAKIDIVVTQQDINLKEFGRGVNIIKLSSASFTPKEAGMIIDKNARYDTVVCAFSNKDIAFYSNVIAFAAKVRAKNYLAFNDDYQFNTINSFCKNLRLK